MGLQLSSSSFETPSKISDECLFSLRSFLGMRVNGTIVLSSSFELSYYSLSSCGLLFLDHCTVLFLRVCLRDRRLLRLLAAKGRTCCLVHACTMVISGEGIESKAGVQLIVSTRHIKSITQIPIMADTTH